MLTSVKTDIEELPELPGFKLTVTAKLNGQTGVEMEALTGVSVGLADHLRYAQSHRQRYDH